MRLGPAGMFLILLLASAESARAEGGLSPYEAESLRRAIESVHGSIDVTPEGKIVEGIDVVALEVIEDRDPAPAFLNVLHTTTRRKTIVRESLLRPGDLYRKERVDET